MPEVEIELEDQPLYSGVAAIGENGVMLPTIPPCPPHKLMGKELPLQLIAARISAMHAYVACLTSAEGAAKLDLQFNLVEHVEPSGPDKHVKQYERLRGRPLHLLPHLPLCAP